MKIKWNHLATGIVIGLISPLLAFYIFCLFAFPDNNFIQMIQHYSNQNILTHVISLSVIFNLPLFFILLNMNLEQAARGVIGATFIYAFIVVILKIA